MEAVRDRTVSEVFDAIDADLDALQAVGVTPLDADQARELIARIENAGRRLQSVQVDLVAEIDRTGAYRVDGHASAKVMVRHVADLSPAEAARRARCAKAIRHLPAVRGAFAEGRIGRCQVERIARAHANPRVRAAVEAQETSFAAEAEGNEYSVFDRLVDEWVRLMDADGTRDRDQSAHEKRDARLHQGFDGRGSSWAGAGRWPGRSWRRSSRRS